MTRKKTSILKTANIVLGGAIPMGLFWGMVPTVMYLSNSQSFLEESKEIKERVYQEYILTDEFIEQQLEFSNSLNKNYKDGTISNQTYKDQLAYMTSKEYAYDLLENSEYIFLKNEYSRAEELNLESDKTHKNANTSFVIAGSVSLASTIGYFATRETIKKEEKKEIQEAQEKSHALCKEVLDEERQK